MDSDMPAATCGNFIWILSGIAWKWGRKKGHFCLMGSLHPKQFEVEQQEQCNKALNHLSAVHKSRHSLVDQITQVSRSLETGTNRLRLKHTLTIKIAQY